MTLRNNAIKKAVAILIPLLASGSVAWGLSTTSRLASVEAIQGGQQESLRHIRSDVRDIKTELFRFLRTTRHGDCQCL